MELEGRRIEGRRIALDLIEFSQHKKGFNRAKKQERRERKEKVCHLLYSVDDEEEDNVTLNVSSPDTSAEDVSNVEDIDNPLDFPGQWSVATKSFAVLLSLSLLVLRCLLPVAVTVSNWTVLVVASSGAATGACTWRMFNCWRLLRRTTWVHW